MRFDEYFEGLNNVVARLSHSGKERLKRNFNIAIHLSILMKKYKSEIVSVNPPNLLISPIEYIHGSAKYYLTGEDGFYIVTGVTDSAE